MGAPETWSAGPRRAIRASCLLVVFIRELTTRLLLYLAAGGLTAGVLYLNLRAAQRPRPRPGRAPARRTRDAAGEHLVGVRAELLRWMFGFWITTFIGVAGLLIALGKR
jgi:hypothetical protein